jgi:AraC-like DNA-binding protein
MPSPDADAEVMSRVAPLPRNLLDCLREGGVDPDALARRLGIEPGRLSTGLDFVQLDRFFCAAWEALDDPAFGLRAGCVLRPERFGVVGLVTMSAPTLGVAFERKVRYGRLVWGDAYDLTRRGPRATVRLATVAPPRPYTQSRIDMELASFATFARQFTGVAVVPLQVTLRQGPPVYEARYPEVFGCPIAFAQADDSIAFRTQDLELPLISADHDVDAALLGVAEKRLERIDATGDALAPRVNQALRRLLRGDEPTLAAVAAELHMSERTLQRRLAEHKLSFSDLLDGVRHEAAQQYLRARHITVDEVAFLLGFATPSSFFRAFKRWTGTTPQGWRMAAPAVGAGARLS